LIISSVAAIALGPSPPAFGDNLIAAGHTVFMKAQAFPSSEDTSNNPHNKLGNAFNYNALSGASEEDFILSPPPAYWLRASLAPYDNPFAFM
jgi:hypothetical protein